MWERRPAEPAEPPRRVPAARRRRGGTLSDPLAIALVSPLAWPPREDVASHVAAEAAALAARDRADSTRPVAPLRRAEDAIDLDTTELTFQEQVRFIVDRARSVFGLDRMRPGPSNATD